MDPTTIAIIGTVLTFIQTIVIVVGAIFAVSQLRENTRVRRADVIDRVFEYVVSQDVRDARRRIRGAEFPTDMTTLSKEQKNDVELVLARWARIGILLQLGLFDTQDEEMLFRTYSWSINNSWQKLKPYVMLQRQQAGVNELWQNVQVLSERARLWRQERDLPV